MVCERGRCRDGGRRGGRGRSQPAPLPIIPMAPASPPSEIPQPNCPGGRPFPHNTFQTTHFKFHNRLNKPILLASITVIFAEEEAQSSASVHTSASLSQGGKQSGEDVGNVFNSDNVQAEKGMPEDIKQPDGTLQGVLGSVDQACRPFGIRRSVAIPDGSGLKVETTVDEVCLGPACPVVEELKDHGSYV